MSYPLLPIASETGYGLLQLHSVGRPRTFDLSTALRKLTRFPHQPTNRQQPRTPSLRAGTPKFHLGTIHPGVFPACTELEDAK